jgi:hypothetical protein
MSVKDKLVGTVIGATAAIGVLGAGWAWAQEAPTTTTPPTTVAPGDNGATAPAPNGDGTRPHCDHNGDGVPDAPPSSSSSNTATNL